MAQNFVDTLELWNYDFEIFKTQGAKKPIEKISFWRTHPIDDGLSLKLYGKHWAPNITFQIFNLSDSSYCFKESLATKGLSSCSGAGVGGDLIRIGNYILLNRNVCVNCWRRDMQVDYCRSVIKKILNNVDKENTETLDAIVRQFGIKRGERSDP